jgi:hypothetical protein
VVKLIQTDDDLINFGNYGSDTPPFGSLGAFTLTTTPILHGNNIFHICLDIEK